MESDGDIEAELGRDAAADPGVDAEFNADA
jgi:hypothetical protein